MVWHLIHVATCMLQQVANVVETFTFKGSKKEQKSYPELQVGEGILIDSK